MTDKYLFVFVSNIYTLINTGSYYMFVLLQWERKKFFLCFQILFFSCAVTKGIRHRSRGMSDLLGPTFSPNKSNEKWAVELASQKIDWILVRLKARVKILWFGPSESLLFLSSLFYQLKFNFNVFQNLCKIRKFFKSDFGLGLSRLYRLPPICIYSQILNIGMVAILALQWVFNPTTKESFL